MDPFLCLKHTYQVDDGLAKLILEKGKVKSVKKGSFLYYQDEWSDFIAMPISGIFGIFPTSNNSHFTFYNLITPGIIVNEVQYLLEGGSHTDVKAITDSMVIILPFFVVKQLIELAPDFLLMLSKSLAKKQRFSHTLFHLRAEKDAYLKVTGALKAISDVTEDGHIPLNIIALASLLSMSRNVVGKEIKRLIALGVITKKLLGYRLNSSVP
ncbi:Crp/Fnr family transcriptional regulator [Photobacterium sanctipauli]|uniref:Crp/Fnr family transcriptional regulator n=2 Tax=Photobacterium sanctipauli TaxID=1342794 RepID=A0A2T3NNV3_9GAMM|nr:Crp/Fnr family transcriptional regulator [Photobacterium sanctipauli]PSW17647.1 Crp/Fnr family transcriptional regulator [Photobacterium sanctipauli]